MKKLLLLLFVISANITWSQTFVGNKVEKLLNKEIQFKEYDESKRKYRYRNVYLEFDKEKNKFPLVFHKNRPFLKTDEFGYHTNYDSLVGKKFIVKETYDIGMQRDLKSYFCLEIENKETGTFFYKYAPSLPEELEFKIVSSIDIDYCKDFGVKEDKFENITTYRSSSVKKIDFLKEVVDGISNIYLSISITGYEAHVGGKGVFLLFNDGTKIIKKNIEIEVEPEYYKEGYSYSSSMKLNQKEIEMFQNKLLTDFKLFIYEDSLTEEEGFLLREYAKCLTTSFK